MNICIHFHSYFSQIHILVLIFGKKQKKAEIYAVIYKNSGVLIDF